MSICVVDGKNCRCSPSEGHPCPGVVELQAKLTESALQCLASETQAHEHWEDAQRYQFLRNHPRRKDYYTEDANWSVSREQHGMGQVFRGEDLDASIDVARKAAP